MKKDETVIMMTELEKHYNKFNEDKRLTRRRGQVEFITSLKYIHECIDMLSESQAETKKESANPDIKILDVGAGTGSNQK